MPKTEVQLTLLRDDGQQVPLKERVPVVVSRGSGHSLVVENRSDEPITVNGGRRQLKPQKKMNVRDNTTIVVDGKRIIAKVK